MGRTRLFMRLQLLQAASANLRGRFGFCSGRGPVESLRLLSMAADRRGHRPLWCLKTAQPDLLIASLTLLCEQDGMAGILTVRRWECTVWLP